MYDQPAISVQEAVDLELQLQEVVHAACALGQNFPTPLLRAVSPYLPGDIELKSVFEVDPRLSDLSDRALFIALRQLGWDGMVTINQEMLDGASRATPDQRHGRASRAHSGMSGRLGVAGATSFAAV